MEPKHRRGPEKGRKMKKIAFLLGIIALAAPAGLWAQEKSPYKPFDSGAPYHAARSRTFHAIHYKLVLSFDETKGEVIGADTVTFTPLGDQFSTLELDSSGLTIDSVSGSGGKKLSFTTPPDKLVIALGHAVPLGTEASVTIKYHGYPERGLYFVHPDRGYPKTVAEIWSQGEEEDNHYWFPCYDYPNDKATSEVIGTVPEDQTLVSNGKLESVIADKAHRTRIFHWKIDQPHSTYLTSITVGPFNKYEQTWKGVPVEYFVAPSIDRETALRSFGGTPDMIEFYAQKTGVPYPYAKYAQSAMEDFGGGMENISATTQTARTLHDERAELDYKSEGLVAHELAHQWFGDMVTCKSWSDIWLNEGFATFWETLYHRHHDGDDEYKLELLHNRDSYFNEDEHRYRRPIVDHNYSHNQDMFDATTYPKGGWVLSMLKYVLGDDAFFRGIHHYAETYKWKNADTHDFQEAMQDATGQNLDWFFNEWLYKAGYPEYKVTASYDPGKKIETVTVEQTQKLDELTPLFTMPVVIDITTAGGVEAHRVTISEKTQTFQWGVNSIPLMVRFDPNDYILKKLDFARSISELTYQLGQDPDITGRIRAAEEIGKLSHDPENARPLVKALAEDPFYGVRTAAAKALSHFKSDEAKDALLAALKDKKSAVRAEAARSLSGFAGDSTVFEALRNSLNHDESYAAEGAAAGSIGKSKNPAAFETLEARLKAEPLFWMASRGVFDGLGELKDKRAVELATGYVAHGQPEDLRTGAIGLLGDMGKDDPRAHDTVIAALTDSNLGVRMAALRALGNWKDPKTVPALQKAADHDAFYQVREVARRVIKEIGEKESAASNQAELDKLRKENQELKDKIGKLEKGK